MRSYIRGVRWRRAMPRWITEFLVLFVVGLTDLLVWYDGYYEGRDGSAPKWLIPAGSLAAVAILLLRRRFPAPVLGIQLLWASASGLTFEEYTPLPGLLVAVNALAQQRPPVRSLLGWLACALPFIMYSRYYDELQLQLTVFLVYMLMAGAAWLLGYRTRIADQRTAERDAATAATTEAVRAERLRIARELHDSVTHAVNVMVLQAAGARAVLVSDPQRAEAALDVVQDVGRQSMNELRRMLCLLRFAGSEDDTTPTEQPDLDGVDILIANTRAAGLTVSKQVWGTPGVLDPSVGLTAYRLVQEALTNSIKHAGPEATVLVGMAWTPSDLTLTVQNNAPDHGKGHPDTAPSSAGHGLLGLRERVQTVGGTLQTGPTATGFVVQAVLPAANPPTAASTSPRVPSAHERILS